MALSWFDQKGGDWTGFLDQGVRLDGKLEAGGMFRIDSEVKGTLVSRETLILGEHAVVEGEIQGNVVTVEGRFAGTIRASGRVEIQAKAMVKGEVYASCVILEPGAAFEGKCHVLSGTTEGGTAVSIPVRSAMSETNATPSA